MIETKKIAAELSARITYTPADDRMLVKPLKPIMITKSLPVDANRPLPTNEEEMEATEKTEVKFEKKKVPANMLKGVVIKLGTEYAKIRRQAEIEGNTDFSDYEVGDVVIFPAYAGISFELFKDTILLRKYEIAAFEKGV